MIVIFLPEENKKHFSATEERARKNICSMVLIYLGCLRCERLVNASESTVKYSQKLQVYVFLIKASSIKKNDDDHSVVSHPTTN